jgi:indole-3-glycerol phosphate synthase
VAESGISTPEDAGRVAALGYRLALVGTALMRRPDPASAVRELLEAGRRALQ